MYENGYHRRQSTKNKGGGLHYFTPVSALNTSSNGTLSNIRITCMNVWTSNVLGGGSSWAKQSFNKALSMYDWNL